MMAIISLLSRWSYKNNFKLNVNWQRGRGGKRVKESERGREAERQGGEARRGEARRGARLFPTWQCWGARTSPSVWVARSRAASTWARPPRWAGRAPSSAPPFGPRWPCHAPCTRSRRRLRGTQQTDKQNVIIIIIIIIITITITAIITITIVYLYTNRFI